MNQLDFSEICKWLCKQNIFYEINKKYEAPLEAEINEILSNDIQIVLSSDAHEVTNMLKLSDIENYTYKYNLKH
jgi:hypothetical protein